MKNYLFPKFLQGMTVEALADYCLELGIDGPTLMIREGYWVEPASLEEIFSECEVISNHLANNEQTRNILHYDLFRRMHDNATFINTGRGAQVVEADLVRALKEKSHCCAILDVTDPEPPDPDSPFFGMENVILTPHLAGSQRDEWWRMAEYMYEEALLLEAGKPTRYHVTHKMLETMA